MFRVFVPAVLAILLAASAGWTQPPAVRIEAKDRQKVTAKIAYEVATTRFVVTRWMLFLPEPPELPSQGSVKVTAAPEGKLLSERSALARGVRFIDLPVVDPTPGSKITVTMEVEAVLRSRTLVQLKASETPPTVAPLTPAEEKAYRAATKHIDHDSRAFGEWLDAKKLRRISTESPLEFAARILSVIRADYRYKFDPDEDKRASVTCKGKAADCGGMGYLFVGALRASDIPARLIVGRLALPRKIDSTPTEIGYDRPHIRAEVYLTGVGWVPVDPAYANTNKQKPVTAFIGADPGDLLVLHVDADFQLPFPDKIRESQLLQIGPYYWTTGRGTFDGYFGPTRWDVKTTRIENK